MVKASGTIQNPVMGAFLSWDFLKAGSAARHGREGRRPEASLMCTAWCLATAEGGAQREMSRLHPAPEQVHRGNSTVHVGELGSASLLVSSLKQT